MREYLGWHFPDIESHFPKMLKKSVDKGGPPEYQHRVRDRSIELCKKRRVALDVGANVGLWTRSLAKNFNTVLAFEPVAMFSECFRKNVQAKNVELLEIALGDRVGMATMIITEGNTGHTHIDPNNMNRGDTQVKTLDSLHLDQVDYIKIDCEGYEYRVIQGGIDTIKRCMPIVVLEQKPHDMYSKQYGQFAAIGLLEDLGMQRLDQVKDDWIMGWY